MSLTRLAVHRPISTLMGSLMVVLLGWMAVSRLAIDLMPDIIFPTISVVTVYEGAAPEEIETLITRPMERTLSAVHGVDELVSTSTEGSSTVRVRFRWGTNLDTAISDIRAKVARLRRNLPDDIDPSYIRRYDIADSPVIYLGLQSELTRVRLTHLAEQTIVPEIESVGGVASVRLRGAVRREIQVNLDRRKLESLNMSPSEVVSVLRRENVNQPAGDFEEGNLKLLVRSRGEFRSLDQIADTVIREQHGAVVRIRDVADIVDGQEEQTQRTRVNGKPGLLIYVYRQAGANTVAVSDNVRRAVASINASQNNARLSVRIDKSEFIRQAIQNVRRSATYGMGLAVIILILFLRSFRSALVITTSMPLSILATFVLIYFKGFTLNIVSFGGLALGIGMLVDNSIVVLESIYRRRADGLDAKTASIEGTREVASAIVASTATTMIVFLPLMFIAGTTGIILHQLAWVVSFSLVCSLLASLTLTPVLAAYWVGQTYPAVGRTLPRRVAEFPAQLLHSVTGRIVGLIERGYGWLLRRSLRHAGVVSFVLLATFTVSVGLVPRIGTEFLPKTDTGDLRLYASMAPGIQLDRLDEQVCVLEQAVLQNVREAGTTAVFIGGDADDADDWNKCWFRIGLPPRSQRRRSIDEIRRDLAGHIGPVAGLEYRIRAADDQMLSRVLRRGHGRGGNIDVQIRGQNPDVAGHLAEQLDQRMKQVPGLVNIRVETEDRRPERTATIDRAKASLLGVSVREITQTLETTIGGTRATEFREDGDEFNVVVRLRKSDRDRMKDVEQVGVQTATGRIVPLENLVTFHSGEGPVAINRLNQQRVMHVSADVDGRDLGSAVGDLQRKLKTLVLPDGFSIRIAGDWEEQQKSFIELRQGFFVALLLMFMVMAAQFESLRDPLLILVTIPLGAVGVILIMVFTGTTLNVQSFIGLVMLSGIVVNNAIVLIDYINRLRRENPELETDEVIARAGVRRLRPILMTTLTTVLAMLPIALGWGEGGELQAPMARVVIGGLASGTLITLVAIPLLSRFVHRGHVPESTPVSPLSGRPTSQM